MINEQIVLSKDEYDDLRVQSTKYAMLLQVLIDEMKLNDGWNKEDNPTLFNEKKLSLILSLIEKNEYENKLAELRGGKENNV